MTGDSLTRCNSGWHRQFRGVAVVVKAAHVEPSAPRLVPAGQRLRINIMQSRLDDFAATLKLTLGFAALNATA